jgi:endonuclease YncB( thermonuclease family)
MPMPMAMPLLPVVPAVPGRSLLAPLVLLLLALVAAVPAAGQTHTGRVVRVTDGDTVVILAAGNEQLRVRLAEIDAPESGQPFGRAARSMLAGLVAGRTVTVRASDTDRYGRIVGRITVQGTKVDANAEMVRRGGAWAYRRYLSDGRFVIWENEARRARRGLWALQADQIVAPWDWRAMKRSGGARARAGTGSAADGGTTSSRAAPIAAAAAAAGTSLSAGYNRGYHSARQARPVSASGSGANACGSKRLCREMTSCEDAMHHLHQCGLTRLDRDGDGVPCESICG